jgi:hypothetical protein
MSNRSFGVIALSIWAILSGALVLTNITFTAAPIILALLLIAAGVLLLLGR